MSLLNSSRSSIALLVYRGLLDWTQQELADAARIGVATIRLFEGEAAESRHATLAVLRRAFELAGVEIHRRERRWPRITPAQTPAVEAL